MGGIHLINVDTDLDSLLTRLQGRWHRRRRMDRWQPDNEPVAEISTTEGLARLKMLKKRRGKLLAHRKAAV
jgi:hypothetical protein